MERSGHAFRHLSLHEGEGRVTLEKGREWCHIGFHVAPRWMSIALPSSFKILS